MKRLDAENLTELPTVDEYKTAFLDSRKVLTEKQLQMLKQNYYAPEHTATAGDLARSVVFVSCTTSSHGLTCATF